ncbi:SsrA-binding protein SmpB [Candidatus Omnitrophota bacterium]
MTKIVANNRKARRDYHVLESVECGIELKGSEVKSLREARVNLEDGFARIDNKEVILYNTHISPYEQASYLNVDPIRPRKLLLHKRQINKLDAQTAQRGFTLIPLKVYFTERGLAKLELGLCKGKQLYDKRRDVKRREQDRYLRRAVKNRKRKK